MDLSRHQIEIQENRAAWERKPLLRKIYAGFYEKILTHISRPAPGLIVELGSGMGLLKEYLPEALATDLFPNPWLDLVLDGYELPFREGSLSHLILFDVFHHLERPNAFFASASRVLRPGGRVLLFEPFISPASYPAYGWFHHEPVGFHEELDRSDKAPAPRSYYAAQGNASRLFFKKEWGSDWPTGFRRIHGEAWSDFSYLLSGGFSRRSFYPASWLGMMRKWDRLFSTWPRLFGARCLVVLER